MKYFSMRKKKFVESMGVKKKWVVKYYWLEKNKEEHHYNFVANYLCY